MKQQERRQARTRYVVMGVVGVIVAAIVVAVGQYGIAAAAGWSAACIVYLVWIWATIGRMDAPTTKDHAYREDPTRTMSDVLLVLASLASLVVTVFVLVGIALGVVGARMRAKTKRLRVDAIPSASSGDRPPAGS